MQSLSYTFVMFSHTFYGSERFIVRPFLNFCSPISNIYVKLFMFWDGGSIVYSSSNRWKYFWSKIQLGAGNGGRFNSESGRLYQFLN